MNEDLRCCGTGTCLINAEGICWCGQRWGGEKMCFPVKVGSVENSKDGVTSLAPGLSPNSSNGSPWTVAVTPTLSELGMHLFCL